MPRYYCDYCDTYLTHDSPSVRKQHNAGYKHKANVRNYYQQFEEQQTQSLIDQKVKEHLGQTTAFQVGAAFHQHIAALQSGQYKPPITVPVLPPPTLPAPGSIPGGTLPIRPPVLPRPVGLPPGYAVPPTLQPPTTEPNGSAQLPMLAPPGAPGVRPGSSFLTSSNGPLPMSTGPGGHQQQSAQSNGLHGNFSSVQGTSSASFFQQGFTAPTANSQHPMSAVVPPGSSGQTNAVYGQNPTGPPGTC